MTTTITSRRHRSIAVVTALAAATTLGACATTDNVGVLGGNDIVTKVLIDSGYSPQNVSFLTAGGAKVEVLGPPGGDAQRVADALEMPARFRPRAFTAVGSDAASRQADRFVLVFGAPENVDGKDACRGLAPPATTAPVVLSVFCDGSEAVTQGRLRSPNLNSPDNPEFTRSIRRLFAQILPARNPEDREGRQRRGG